MKSLDRNSLDEQTRLVSRYVAGDLSRSERAEFEAWLVASPELAAEVEMERRLRRGIASAARRGWLKRSSPSELGRERRWQIAIAASLLVAVGLGLSLLIPRKDAGGAVTLTTRSEPRIASRSIRLASVRGNGGAPDLTLSRADAPGQLVVEPDVVVLTCEDGSIELECEGGSAPQTPQYAEYEMDLVKRRDATVAWRSSREAPIAHAQRVSFTLRDPGSLDAGDYDLIVRGHSIDHSEIVARFWVRITAR